MSKSKSYKWVKSGKKSWVLSKKKQDDKPACTPQKHSGFLPKLTNGLMKTMKTLWTNIRFKIARLRILLASWIIGINYYQMAHALVLLTNTPIYVPEKNEGNRNAKNSRRSCDCNE